MTPLNLPPICQAKNHPNTYACCHTILPQHMGKRPQTKNRSQHKFFQLFLSDILVAAVHSHMKILIITEQINRPYQPVEFILGHDAVTGKLKMKRTCLLQIMSQVSQVTKHFSFDAIHG